MTRHAIENSIWSARCWTYQEYLFSPRKLFFGDMIHYREKRRFETETGIVLAYEIWSIPAQGSDSQFETRGWYNTVQQYASKGLTKSTDRLPAISAIARRVSSIIRTDYLAGLWLSDIQHGLFWTTSGGTITLDEYLNPRKPYAAPSWSWASYPGSVFWAHPISGTIEYRPEYILEKAEVNVPGHNPFGCPTDGCLQFRAKVFHLQNMQIRNDPSILGYIFPWGFHLEGKYVANYKVDWGDALRGVSDESTMPDDGPFTDISMILLSSRYLQGDEISAVTSRNKGRDGHYELDDPEIMIGLLLLPTVEESVYTRCDIWFSQNRELGGRKFWSNISERSISII
ncbi:hypothetical protein N7528_000619 [Penicillium herquei]|nr:hypothetical protein N7528_000619 [Penicillium herquei]